MPILILPPRNAPDAGAVRAAAEAAGWQVEQLTSWRAPAVLREAELVLYGEPLFADVITPALDLALLETPADWLVTLPRAYLRREVQFTTLSEALRIEVRRFVKPAEDKCFPAGVYDSGADLPTTIHSLPDSTPILLSEPVEWEVEYRCFVLNRRVVTYSSYLRNGELTRTESGDWPAPGEESEEMLTFAATFMSDPTVQLPPAAVVDIGRIARHGWAVVEANAAWGSGIYGCDPKLVLPVLARATCRTNSIAPDDRCWVRRQYTVTG